MKNSIKIELTRYVLDLINEGVLTNDNTEEWHFQAFNEDYYIIGYFECNMWLQKHNIDPFEAVSICQQYERDNYGDTYGIYDNSENTVNMLVYIYGEELLNEFQAETVEELKMLLLLLADL